MHLRLINSADVRSLLPIDKCIEVVRQAMTLVATEKAIQPIRQSLYHPDRRGLLSGSGHQALPNESAHAGRLALVPPDGRSPRLRHSDYRYRNSGNPSCQG